MIDFQNFDPPNAPNYGLVCPQDNCQAPVHWTAPVFLISVEVLEIHWHDVIAKEARMQKITWDETSKQGLYQQRTRFLGFPDLIQVKFIALTEQSSTLALYSRSKYGYYDFGVNCRRLARLLNQLQLAIVNAQSD